MKKNLYFIIILLLSTQVLIAQKMRPHTPKEANFYKEAAKFVSSIIPQHDFSDWGVYTKDEKNYYENIAEITPKDIGPYQYEYRITFVLNPEALNKKIEDIQKRMENETDEKKLMKYIEELNNISLHGQVSIRVILNTNHLSISDCVGNHKKVQYLNKDHHWGVDIKYAIQTKNVTDRSPLCAEKTVAIYGTGAEFKYFPHEGNKGGQLVSQIPLKKEVGVEKFSIQNIAFIIEGTPDNTQYFLSKVDWKKITEKIKP